MMMVLVMLSWWSCWSWWWSWQASPCLGDDVHDDSLGHVVLMFMVVVWWWVILIINLGMLCPHQTLQPESRWSCWSQRSVKRFRRISIFFIFIHISYQKIKYYVQSQNIFKWFRLLGQSNSSDDKNERDKSIFWWRRNGVLRVICWLVDWISCALTPSFLQTMVRFSKKIFIL